MGEEVYTIGVDNTNHVVVVAKGEDVFKRDSSLTYYHVMSDSGAGIVAPISEYEDGYVVTDMSSIVDGLDVPVTKIPATPIN